MRVLHNPRCSKSRGVLELLRDAGYTPAVLLYREGALTAALLDEVVEKTGQPLRALLRSKEEASSEALALDDASLPAFVLAHPELLERPIVLTDTAGIVARPPELVWTIVPPEGP